jgi:hypothetical protein
VLLVGFTVIAAVEAELFQVYVPPPVAVRVVDCPAQMVAVPVIAAVGGGATVMVTVSVAEQPALVPVTVYTPLALAVAAVMLGF